MFRCPTCGGKVKPGQGCCGKPASGMVRTYDSTPERRRYRGDGGGFMSGLGAFLGACVDVAGDVLGDLFDGWGS